MKVVLITFLLCSSALARVGETYEELRKRFDGDPIQRKQGAGDLEQITFKKGAIIVEVVMVEGTVSRETYRNVSDYQAAAIREKQANAWERADVGHQGAQGWKSATGLQASYFVTPVTPLPGQAAGRSRERIFTIWDGRADGIESVERAKERAAQMKAHLDEIESF